MISFFILKENYICLILIKRNSMKEVDGKFKE